MSRTTLCCVWCWIIALPLALLLTMQVRGEEKLPAGLEVQAVGVVPEAITLGHAFDYRQLLVNGRTAAGETVDLTRLAKFTVANDCVAISADGVVRAAKDGSTELIVSVLDKTFKVPVQVAGVASPKKISFLQDVQPVLSRMGCNQGTCHGAKDGKNGFKLSLRGYDPIYDHRALTDDIGARRFNRANPDQSLMLLKSTGSIPHVGGVRTNVGEPYYNLVREWIAQGVKTDLQAPRVSKIDILPQNPIIPRPGMKQQMQVIATYTDGMVRDVTREAFIESGNIEVLEAAQTGVVTTLRRGESPVLVRYEGSYAATTIICMGDRSGFAWEQPPTYNYVDGHVYKKLERMKILPSGLCSDSEFIRRVYIDLTGLLPTAAAVEQFLADPRESRVKREALVDELVGSRPYVEYWTNKWADMLQVNRKFLGEEGAMALRNWIKDSIATNKPYNQFAAEVLTASGSTLDNPPAAYWKVIRDPESLMENTTHLFLAVRFNCNKCHDHPFERWTQDQYYHLSAYFAQVGRKEDAAFQGQKIGGSAVEGATPLVEVVYDSGGGDVKHNRTGQIAPPSFPYAHADAAAATLPRRKQLSQWMTSKENQYFAKSYVNRLWGYLFGTGIIEPIDDIRAGNPPSNPELLDQLTQEFIANNFDMQHMLRTICKSRAYQHSVATNKWNDDDTVNYSHAIPRRLTAESLFDAIHVATGSTPRLPGVPAGFRASELSDAGLSDAFLEDFGKPVRESACECERSSGVVLGPILKLINGPTVGNAVADPGSELSKLVATEKDDAKLIEQVFLRFLARRPTDAEVKLGIASLAAPAEDVGKLTTQLAEYEKTIPAKLAAWEKELGGEVTWRPLEFAEMKSAIGAKFDKLPENAVLVSGPEGHDTYTLAANTDLPAITGVRLEALPDDALPTKGPGRSMNGNFVLNELKLATSPVAAADKLTDLKFGTASATFSQESWPATGAVDGNEGTGWAISPKFGEAHTAIFELAQPAKLTGETRLTFQLVQKYADGKHLLGKFRISVTASPRPVSGAGLPAPIAAIVKIPADQRTDEQKAALVAHFRSQDGEIARLTAEVKRAQDQAVNARLFGVQDLAWALINNPAFLFNR